MSAEFDKTKRLCEESGVRMVDFKVVDLDGRWRHLTIPAERFTEEIIEAGTGFDASNYGFARVEKSDMVFVPDLSTAMLDPFCQLPTLSLIGDVMEIGESPRPFGQYPRSVAKAAEAYMKSSGIADEMRTGPEYEFYLFDGAAFATGTNRSYYKVDARQAEWNSGEAENNGGFAIARKGGYHICPPMDVNFGLRSEICRLLESCGVRVKYHHHEVGGPGQQEIEVEPGAMCAMADNTMLVKYVVRNAAHAAGKSATFMPKPLYGEAGSGLHVHMHLFKGGKPVFHDDSGYSGLSREALFFIGGLLTHARALCAFTNPSTNSYKRLVPGYEAPVNICYATANRSAVIRIPDYARRPEQKRFEMRNPDATCNPYYAFAALLMAGLDGIRKGIDPDKAGFGPYDLNLYTLPMEEQRKIKPLPFSLSESLAALEEDNGFLTEGGVFPERLIETWIDRKRREALDYEKYPHPVEFTNYFDL